MRACRKGGTAAREGAAAARTVLVQQLRHGRVLKRLGGGGGASKRTGRVPLQANQAPCVLPGGRSTMEGSWTAACVRDCSWRP